MNKRWRGAAIVAALLLGAPAYGQGAGSQMGTGGQRSPGDDAARTTTGNQGSGQGSDRDPAGSAGSTSSPHSSPQTGSASSSTHETGTGSATATSASSGSQSQLKGDLEERIQELHLANQSEVQLGELGVQNAQSPEVKEYARMLKEDHQKNDEQLQQLAQTMGVNLQGEKFQKKQKEAQEHLSDLQKKQGKEFDKEFMSHMVKDHKKDVKEVEKAAKEARKQNQTQLASFLETTHTGLQGHLQEAQRIEKSLKGSTGEMGTGSGATSPGGGTGSSGSGTGTSGAGGTGGGSTGSSSGTGR
jgi:putative membrane protein